MSGIIGKKIGMTSLFTEAGKNVACTVIEAGPCVVTQIKTNEKDGYSAVQLGFDEKKEKNTSAALKGHFKKSGSSPKKKLVEFLIDPASLSENDAITYEEGQNINVDIFNEGEWVDVVGTSKGRGFQGVVKRHGFHGVGGQTHGQHNRGRTGGSIGAASYPARVFKGMRMPGRMGGNTVKAMNLKVIKVVPEKNLLIVKGCIPGTKGSYLSVEKY